MPGVHYTLVHFSHFIANERDGTLVNSCSFLDCSSEYMNQKWNFPSFLCNASVNSHVELRWTLLTSFSFLISFTGLQTSQDARFYALSTKFSPFSNRDKPLVIQFSVKHEQNIDCGGGYLKVFDCSLEPKELHGDSPYLVMFGPDICGPGTKKVGSNLLRSHFLKYLDTNHVRKLFLSVLYCYQLMWFSNTTRTVGNLSVTNTSEVICAKKKKSCNNNHFNMRDK